MSEHRDIRTKSEPVQTDTSDKKMVRGSFAISLLVHGLILLLIGSIIVVPGVVREMRHITTIAPPPAEVPEPPKMEEIPDAKADDGGGSPIGDVPDTTSSSTTPDAAVDALTVVSPVSTGPSMNAASGASVSVDAFAGGKGGSGGGTGTGVGTGSGAGIGKKTYFGTSTASVEALKGTFYDLKQTRDRKPSDVMKSDHFPKYQDVIREFVEGGWSTSKLSEYFQPKVPLYTTQIFIPEISADLGPKAFNVEKEVEPMLWIIHYKGSMKAARTGTFRFVGNAGEILIVRFQGRTVLDACHSFVTKSKHPASNWISKDKSVEDKYPAFGKGASSMDAQEHLTFGDWVDFEKDKTYPFEVLIGERGGGTFNAWLLIQNKADPIKVDAEGRPILSLFSSNAKPEPIPDYKSKDGPAKPDHSY